MGQAEGTAEAVRSRLMLSSQRVLVQVLTLKSTVKHCEIVAPLYQWFPKWAAGPHRGHRAAAGGTQQDI